MTVNVEKKESKQVKGVVRRQKSFSPDARKSKQPGEAGALNFDIDMVGPVYDDNDADF